MIDIARAKLPGGRQGDYEIGRGMSALVFAQLGVTVSDFVRLVAEATSDDELAERILYPQSEPSYKDLSARLRRVTVGDVPKELRPEFERFYGADVPSDQPVFDILEADDAKTFGNRSV
jgi:hypothetical protein